MWIKVLIAFAVLIGALVAVDRLVAALIHLSRRSRTAARKAQRSERATGTGGGVLDVFQEIVQPEIRMVRQDQRQRIASISVDNVGAREPSINRQDEPSHEEHPS